MNTSRTTPPQQIAVTLPKRSFGGGGRRQSRRGWEDVVVQSNFTQSYFALPKKLALRLVSRPSQLRWEGDGGTVALLITTLTAVDMSDTSEDKNCSPVFENGFHAII